MSPSQFLWLVPPLSRTLSAGGAPVRWRRELGHSAARLDGLHRSAAWVEALAQAKPQLLDAQLWGNCLPALMAVAPDLAAADPQVVRSSQAIAGHPRERFAHARSVGPAQDRLVASPQTARSLDELRPHRPIPDLSGLPQRASLALLRRVAGEASNSDAALLHRSSSLLTSLMDRSNGADAPQSLPQLLPELFVGQRMAQGSVRQECTKGEPFFRGIGGAVQRSWRDAFIARSSYLRRHAGLFSDAQVEQYTAVLTRQWAAPIEGPTASPELLIKLGGLLLENGSVVRGRAHHRGASPPASEYRGRQAKASAVLMKEFPGASTRAPSPVGVDDELFLPTQVARPHAARSRPLLTPTEGESPAGSSVGATGPTRAMGASTGASSPVGVDDELFSPMQVARPHAARGRPLLTLTEGESPVASSVGATDPARATPIEVSDDLSVLAAKIKRILEEEARRHGIDV